MSKPSIGRIVHFYDADMPDSPVAAIIVRVWSDTCVNLRTFGDHAFVGYETSVVLDDAAANKYWSWPPRVE